MKFCLFWSYRVLTVLKSSWILGEVLKKSLNSILSLKSPKISVQVIENSSSEKLKVFYMKGFLFYAIINYLFKTSEPKNVEKFVGAKSSRLNFLSEWTGNVHFCTVSDITFLVGGPWKVLKNGFNFLYEPCHNLVICKHSFKVVVTMYIVLVYR